MAELIISLRGGRGRISRLDLAELRQPSDNTSRFPEGERERERGGQHPQREDDARKDCSVVRGSCMVTHDNGSAEKVHRR